MLTEKLKPSGTVGLILTDQYGVVKDSRQYKNYITNLGKAYIASNMHELTYNTTTVAGTSIPLDNHVFANGDEIIFTNLGGNTGVLVNTLYFVVNATTNAFSVAATEGGTAISITGTAGMTFRCKQNNMTVMALGTGNTLPSDVTTTTLVTEIGTRQPVTTTRFTTAVTNDTIQYVATFGAGISTGAVNEAGIFNAATGGLMLCRTVFGGGSGGVINKQALDTLTVTWRIQIT